MMKLKHYSIAVIATLTLFAGCKSGSNDTTTFANAKSIDNPAQLSDAEKLAVAAIEANKKPDISDDENSKSRALQNQNCPNGGTMEMEMPDFSNPMQMPQDYTFTISLHDCVDDGVVENGSMQITSNSDATSGDVLFTSDYTMRGGGEDVFVKKGSTFRFRKLEDGWEELLIDADMSYNGIRHVGKDLIYHSKFFENGTILEYPVSGKEQIGESALFEVDPTYDASKTPFKSGKDDIVVSGKSRYIDSDGHQVEIEVVAANIVSVKVDKNGDKTFDETEISTIKLH
jgi:hypothetical protein